jgi:DHA2 family multidrug resistance protein-like MFS transporter
MALGIAVLGSIVAGVYRGLAIPPGIPDGAAAQAMETLGGAHEVAATLRGGEAHELLTAASSAFTEGLAVAAGVGSVLLLGSAAAVWLLLKPAQLETVSPCSKLNTPSGSYVALTARKRLTFGPQ